MILFDGKAWNLAHKEIVMAWNFGRLMEVPKMVHHNGEFSPQEFRLKESIEPEDFGRN